MIRLESVEISRFRGIRSGTLRDLVDVNILIGRNNSGKSTVAEAVTWSVCRRWDTRDPLNRNPTGIWFNERNSSDNEPDLWYRQDQSKKVAVTSTIGGIRLLRSVERSLPVTEQCVPEIVEGHDVHSFAKAMTVFRPPDSANRQIETSLWQKVLADRSDKHLTRMFNHIFAANAEGFQLLPDQRLLLMFPDYSIGVDLQGDGTRAALRCLMVLAVLRSTLFIMEEPESHQHPGSLERFALAVCEQSKKADVQLVITTHSAECLRSFLTATKSMDTEAAVFHLQLDDGVLDANRLDAETVDTLQSTGVDVRCLDLYS